MRANGIIHGGGAAQAKAGWRVALTTMPATRPTLGVSRWPDFDYDATGATTLGHVCEARNGELTLEFDVSSFEGPPVDSRSTKVFGVPLPPGICIEIVPLTLRGSLDTSNGTCSLDFDAEFRGSIFGEDFIALPPMTVRSPLTTGDAVGAFRRATGAAFGQSGAGNLAELVGIARVPRVEGDWDWLMNALLMLPTDALAVLPCRLRIWDPDAPITTQQDVDDAMREDLEAWNRRFDELQIEYESTTTTN